MYTVSTPCPFGFNSVINLLFTGQKHDTKSPADLSSHGAAESEGLVNLGLFADRRSAYRMLATEGT